MYIMLRGQVTVYHNYEDGSLEDPDAEVTPEASEELRQHLGAFVVTLQGE